MTPEMQREIATWPEIDRDEVRERQSIMEFDGMMSREKAELEAFLCVKACRFRDRLAGIDPHVPAPKVATEPEERNHNR